jgi:anti-anti-sigma factor
MSMDPSGFSIADEERGSHAVVVPRGELDLATAPQLDDVVQAHLAAGRDVIVDLRELDFMDSSGLRVLVAGHTRARANRTRFAITRPAPTSPVARILSIAGIDTELELIDEP